MAINLPDSSFSFALLSFSLASPAFLSSAVPLRATPPRVVVVPLSSTYCSRCPSCTQAIPSFDCGCAGHVWVQSDVGLFGVPFIADVDAAFTNNLLEDLQLRGVRVLTVLPHLLTIPTAWGACVNLMSYGLIAIFVGLLCALEGCGSRTAHACAPEPFVALTLAAHRPKQ